MHKVGNPKRIGLLVSLAVMLAGCTYRQISPEPGEGVAYVLNTVISKHSEPQPVLVDGAPVAELRPGQFTWLRLTPGNYSFTVSGAPFQGKTLSSDGVEIRAGEVRYLVYDEEKNEPYLIEYSETHARRWLRGKRFVPSHLGSLDG
jgi:hypothetical protein